MDDTQTIIVDKELLESFTTTMDQVMVIIGGAQILFIIGIFIVILVIASHLLKVLKEAHAALVVWNESQRNGREE